jgi:hypothetical protein
VKKVGSCLTRAAAQALFLSRSEVMGGIDL